MAQFAFARHPRLHGAIDQHEQHELELIIAIARAFLAGIALVTISIDPREPTRYGQVAYWVLIGYDLHSAAALALLRFGPVSAARLGPLFHGIDLAWAITITFLIGGLHRSPFVLFVFVLLAAAYRWGFRETLLTGSFAAAFFLVQAAAAALGLSVTVVDVYDTIIHTAHFLMAAFLLAFLSEQAKGLRAEAVVANRLVEKIRIQDGLTASMGAVLEDLLKLFGSRQALLVLEEPRRKRVVLWTAVLHDSKGPALVRSAELEPSRRQEYLFPMPPDVTVWEVSRTSQKDTATASGYALNGENRRIGRSAPHLSAAVTDAPWSTLVGLDVDFAEESSGRLFLFDPTARPAGQRRIKFLQGVMGRVAPVLHNVYLFRRLRSRIGAIERARVARELHDSVIQSLIGLEMQLDVARRDSTLAANHAERLTHIQSLLRHEILNVRDLMQQLQPQPDDSKQLVERLGDLVDRFKRETDIDATFVAELKHDDLPAELCRELTRMVQESLVNVRKHSGASHVCVHLRADDWAWKLSVSDDGRGFGFTGSLSHADLRSRRLGPRVIRERAEAVGGKLMAISGANGARLEIVGRMKKPWILTPSA